MQLSEAFCAVMDYVDAQGAAPLNQYEGCWESRVDERWTISLNGHNVPVADSAGGLVPEFSCAIGFNGWPAGIIDPFGNGLIAAGALANEDAFIEALQRAVA